MHIHLISNPLYRPNGIIEYIRADLSKNPGFVITDSEPNYNFSDMFRTEHLPGKSHYLPEMPNGVPCLQWDYTVVTKMSAAIEKYVKQGKYTEIYAHCAKSYLAANYLGLNPIFVQHESDILNITLYPTPTPANVIFSYMSLRWLDQHKHILTNGYFNPRIASLMVSDFLVWDDLKVSEKIVIPYAIELETINPKPEKIADIVLLADGSHRKGWDIFFDWWDSQKRSQSVSVLSHEKYEYWPKEWNTKSFRLNEIQERAQFIAAHDIAFVPSRSEGFCIAAYEAITQVPTYFVNFNNAYAGHTWHKHFHTHKNYRYITY